MITYSIIILTTFTSILLILLSPPDKFYKRGVKWHRKFTWRAWLVMLLSLVTMLFTIQKQSKDDADSNIKQAQIDRLEKNDSILKSQLYRYGLNFDSNSNKILSKIDSSTKQNAAIITQKPFLDLCKKGIQVNAIDDTTISVNIPYCAVTNDNAYNVSLHSTVIYNNPRNYRILNQQREKFPANIIITKETGRAIEYKLSPISYDQVDSIYLFVSGTYTNIDKSTTYFVRHIFKRSGITSDWVRVIGPEDESLKIFLKQRGLF